jgi:hypothetical protein
MLDEAILIFHGRQSGELGIFALGGIELHDDESLCIVLYRHESYNHADSPLVKLEVAVQI